MGVTWQRQEISGAGWHLDSLFLKRDVYLVQPRDNANNGASEAAMRADHVAG